MNPNMREREREFYKTLYPSRRIFPTQYSHFTIRFLLTLRCSDRLIGELKGGEGKWDGLKQINFFFSL